jgi:hypothetical protein
MAVSFGDRFGNAARTQLTALDHFGDSFFASPLPREMI